MNWTHTYKGDRVRVVDLSEQGLAVIEYETPQPIRITMTDSPPTEALCRYAVVRASELTPL